MRNKRTRKSNTKKLKFEPLQVIIMIFILVLVFFLFFKLINKKNTTDKISSIQDNNLENSNLIGEQNVNQNTTQNEKSQVVENKSQENQTKKDTPANDITFSMAITGDIMCHNTMYQDAYDSSTKSYDFSYMFDDISQHIQTADVAIGNLETTFAGSKVRI